MTTPRIAHRAILRLAVPALGTLAIDPVLTLIDTAFVARVGVDELAALGVDTAILGFAFFGFNFLAYATTPLVAQALGRGNPGEARRWVGDALLLAAGLGVLAAAILELLAPWFVGLMGAGEGVAEAAVSYLRIRAIATPAVLIVTAAHGAFRGHQDTRTPLLVAVGINVINLVFDPLLIFVAGLGLEGAALGTVIAQWAGAAWFLILVRRRRLADRPGPLRQAIPTILSLARSGMLVAIRTGFLLAGLTIAAATATRLGPSEIAAHQVVMQVWLLAAMVADAFAIAAQAMVGAAVGSGDSLRIHRLSSRLLAWGVATGVLLLAVFALGAPALELLVEDPEVAALTISAAAVAGWMMPVGAPLFVADGIFFGLLAFGTIILSTAVGAVVLITLITATPLGETLDGIWWGISAMLAARGLVFVFAYRRAVGVALRS
ncbi:MAG TPA: MATE family efflux transporter [Acidimicrobiia bacterium]|nr:MATE family efflux transporter [Acidimicrobiia bacterium]